MRSVHYSYLKEARDLLEKSGIAISNSRLRRLSYLDVHQNNYTLFSLYNRYKKIVNSDAANNQIMVLVIVVGLITAGIIFLLIW